MPRLARRPHTPRTEHTEAGVDLGLERLVFLSDGLFAIAMTILVIDLRLPDLPIAATSDQVGAALGALAPRVFAFALSFAIISFYWIAHWRRFKLIERADATLAYLNLIQLAFIALIPFPTAVIGEHGDTAIATVVYAGTLSAAGVTGFLTWAYAARAGLAKAGVPHDYVRSGAIRGLSVPVIMLGSLPFLLVTDPSWVERSWILILPAQWLLTRRIAR